MDHDGGHNKSFDGTFFIFLQDLFLFFYSQLSSCFHAELSTYYGLCSVCSFLSTCRQHYKVN